MLQKKMCHFLIAQSIHSNRKRVLDVPKIRSSSPWYTEIGSSIYRLSPAVVYNPCFTKTQITTNKISKPLDIVHRKTFLSWRCFFVLESELKILYIGDECLFTLQLCLFTKQSSVIYLTMYLPISTLPKLFVSSLLTNHIFQTIQ